MASPAPCSSSSRSFFLTTTLPSSPSQSRRWRGRPLPPPPLCSSSSSSSYHGWADLAAAPDLPLFPLPLQPATHRHGLLFLLPAAAGAALALSLSRLPPLPLLAAAFTAGFAARHLSPSPSPQSDPALLADLDAQLRALRAHLLSEADPALLVQAVDRLRDAVADAARFADTPLLRVLGEVADCLRAWARNSLSSPRKKQPPVVSSKNNSSSNSDVAKPNHYQAAAAAAAAATRPQQQQQQQGSASDMLQFDGDDSALKADAEVIGVQAKKLERLVFKHRVHARHPMEEVDDGPFQPAASSRFSTESMQSSLLERTLEIRDRSYRFKVERRDGGSQVTEAHDRADESFVYNAPALDPVYDQSATTDSDGDEFSRNVKEAAEILRKARESMADEETADALLYKSASLLSAAVALRPTSLVAVGQLGNTYLLHGELKLKISRELRTLLATSGALLNGRDRVSRSRKVDSRILSAENISSALVDVCEECESLLVEAGRSYRTALSIDSGDVKALYNWGLALIFRAQLLADIGPEAAVDADRVYLAAIDKFDAMLSRSNTYAPEGLMTALVFAISCGSSWWCGCVLMQNCYGIAALYRWGTALQQRSHLRPRNNREKIRLLEQAKSLFEDVLYVEADNKMVREALSSCISELNYHGRWL
ncbi:unnamed protein product [Urochloa decumbens]|uniref:Uncharacterized protein n=1 Tax=Urochloa decumbens TaxID=240449 RepID=A0ABC9E3P8_9POAL